MRKVVTLRFCTTEQLWKFWNEIQKAPYRLSLTKRILTQNFTEQEVQLAITKYDATVVDPEE